MQSNAHYSTKARSRLLTLNFIDQKMINLQTYQQLGHADHGWLDARHHFSFAGYHNPKRMGFGKLRVINDDIIAAGSGFGMHQHHDMEIITYVRTGAITHKDDKGNQGRTVAGDVQVMSAGTGIFHSEFNLENMETTIYQIWIEPSELGVSPRWETATFPKQLPDNQLSLLVSGKGDAPLSINSDARIYAGQLSKNTTVTQTIEHQAYVLISDGQIKLDSLFMNKGDGAQVTEQTTVNIKALNDGTEVLLIDVPGLFG